MNEPRRYRLARGAVRIEVLDDLALAHHRPSGATHVLAPETHAIVEALGDAWTSVGEIGERLERRFGAVETDGDAPAAVIAARLDELTGAGLVEVER